MNLSGFVFTIVMLGSFLPYQNAATLRCAEQRPRSASPRSEQAVIEYLRPVVNSMGKGASIYYRGVCSTGIENQVAFPKIETRPPSKPKTGLLAIREIFLNDKNVVVTSSHSGVARIRIGIVPDKVLQARIPILTLTPLEQYDPVSAIYAVENTKEIKAAARKLGVHPAPFSPGLANIFTPPGSPHLPSSLKNVTVEQVLDLIAKTFKGIAIYGVCTQRSGQSLFRLGFVDIASSASPNR